ncbi:metallophosphoesterase [Chitinophaga sp. HK235]|uniref:metallophosphoesterase n=1 Tax=Chitinophaga sp. HK235 TaxID=2952571 RepID=UPI00201161EA|nr:metallophosphoesterase [Chitinophaga sp. HK235]
MSSPIKKTLARLIIRLSGRLSSRPDKKAVFASLSQLHEAILKGKKDRGPVVPFASDSARIIIFSDQHKGARDAADDFRDAAATYSGALKYYYDHGFTFINLGDCEELWENKPAAVMAHNQQPLQEEAGFLQRKRYYRIFGNHDLEWHYLVPRRQFLRPLFGKKLRVHEGLILQTQYNGDAYRIFLAHGHQGDRRSDGNTFSKWFVAAIWTPVQRFLDIHPDTLSESFDLVDAHNIMMYEWSLQVPKTLFISGHTHKPVFASMDHIDRLNKQLQRATAVGDTTAVSSLEAELRRRADEYAGKQFVKTMAHPTYFNTGCCCFNDGDITGIEIADGFIRLIKWTRKGSTVAHRKVLEECPLYYIFDQLHL